MNRRHFLFLLPVAARFVDEKLFGNESTATLLRYRFNKGEELRWNVRHTLKMKTIISGREENIETSSRSVKIWKTLEVDDKGAGVFEYRVEDVDMHQAQTERDDLFYNSRRDKTIPHEFNNLKGKIGIPLARIKIEPQGQTTKKPIQEYEGSIEENRIVIPLPNEPVGIGSTWSEMEQVDHPQPNQTVKKIKIRHEFTLEKMQSGLALIKFSSTILTWLSPKMELELIKNFSVGTMELDLQAGHFIRHEATIDRQVVGIQGASDSVRYLSRTTECCCGRRACDICR